MINVMESQRKELVGALSDLYANGALLKANRISDGRGGFTGLTESQTVLLHRENTREETARRNITPGNALIYVLNTGQDIAPLKGDGLTMDGQSYMVVDVAQDPIGVAYECECEHGGRSDELQ